MARVRLSGDNAPKRYRPHIIPPMSQSIFGYRFYFSLLLFNLIGSASRFDITVFKVLFASRFRSPAR
jgi:hypothetical protein